jgi:hypothetical protein
VTGFRPDLYNDTLPKGVEEAIVVGSASSRILGDIKSDFVDGLKGKWESYDARVMEKPLKGLQRGLVIAGSDRVSNYRSTFDAICSTLVS